MRRGFVERNEDVEDRRMKRVRLTDEGSAVIRRLNAARLRRLAQFVDTLSPGTSTTSSPPPFPRCSQREDLANCRPEEAIQ